MQWHSSQNSNHFDDFWSGSTSAYAVNLRDVSGVGTPVAGQSLCKNGITSYKTCEDVYQLNHCKDGACHLVAMHRRHAAPGDSGGPWFWGNTAYGLHQGYKVYWFIERDLFTMAVNIPNGMPAVYVLVDG
jgi:hypothetical protein